MNERYLIALGGLLHDIGKFVQRGTNKKASEADKFGYAHAQLSYEETKRMLDILGIENEDERNLVLSACFHHKPDTDHPEAPEDLYWVRALFRLADWYGSTERSKLTDIENEKLFKRLRPVFETVRIKGKERKTVESIIRLATLSLEEETIFPKPLKEAMDWARDPKSELYDEYYGDYLELWEKYKEALSSLRKKEIKNPLSIVYYLLYKYLWCVPASIYDREKYHSHYPDISLFDHSRVVSALASAMHSERNREILENYDDGKREEFANRIELLIFEGDISGIQRFLYDIANVRGVSKRLRGRSTFITFLPEIVGRHILEHLEYPWTSMLYVGGGKFQAIVGYEEGIEEKLRKLATKVEESLIEEFGGKLGFVVYHKRMKLSDLKRYDRVVRELMEEAERAKKRKFAFTIEGYEDIANKEVEGPLKLCPSCGWEPIEEREEVCRWCDSFMKVGGIIPKSHYVAFSKGEIQALEDRGFYIEGIGGVYFLNEVKKTNGFSDILLINEPENFEVDPFSTGFKFLGQSVPMDEEGEIKTFEELAQEAEGDHKIAYVKADVDNMGLIFMAGLGEYYTISRVATLSRSLDLFFSGYLNTLFEREFNNKIYTVYAGGDDLLIVAPWDVAMDAIVKIREKFGEFTCNNASFGLSAGLYTTPGHYPIRLASEGVSRAEDRAKNKAGKDSIDALGETLRWEDISKHMEDAKQVIEKIISGEIGRTNLYRIYMLLKEYQKLEREGDEKRYMFYPFFYYYLVRNIKEEDREAIENLFIDKALGHKVRESAVFLAKYVLMKTRDVRGAKVGTFKE